jgi:hypothetical protein
MLSPTLATSLSDLKGRFAPSDEPSPERLELEDINGRIVLARQAEDSGD